jgi:hypothetical protein
MSQNYRYTLLKFLTIVGLNSSVIKPHKMGDRKEICVRCQSETLRLIAGIMTSSEVWPAMMSWMTLVTQFVSHNKQSFADPNNWRASLAPDMTSLNTLIALLLLCSFSTTFRSASIFSVKVCIVIAIVRGNCCLVSDDRTIISADGEILVGITNRTERALWATKWHWTGRVSNWDTALSCTPAVTGWNVLQDLKCHELCTGFSSVLPIYYLRWSRDCLPEPF